MLAPRYTAATLGLLAFSVSILAGIWARNPVAVVLSRSIWAMALFAFIGLVTGAAARRVVREYIEQRESELFAKPESRDDDEVDDNDEKSSIHENPKPMGT